MYATAVRSLRGTLRRSAFIFAIVGLLIVPGVSAQAAPADSYDYAQAFTSWDRQDPAGFGTWHETLAIFGPFKEIASSSLSYGTIDGTHQCTVAQIAAGASLNGSFTERFSLRLAATGGRTASSDGTFSTSSYEAVGAVAIGNAAISVTHGSISRTTAL